MSSTELSSRCEELSVSPRLLGELVGREVLRVSWLARQLGVEPEVLVNWSDEICPPWPEPPVVPKHVWAVSLGDPDHEWIRAYQLGLSLTLALAEGWQREAPIVREALANSTAALRASLQE